MEFSNDFQRLRAENELLLVRLLDLDTLISAREEELQMLRQLAEEGRQLRSKLDAGTLESENLRQELEVARREARGLEGRSEEMEKELIESIRNQSNYSELLGKSGSMQAEIEILQNELAESTRLNDKLGDLEARLVELTSRLEIAELDRDSLRRELDELRRVREDAVLQEGDKPIEKDN